jgi:hypothetical protein
MLTQPAADQSELDEWNAIAKRGASARRKAMVPKIVAALAFAIVTAGVFVGLGSAWSKSAAAEEADKQARIARGERVYEWHRRGSTKETRAAGDVFLLAIIAIGAGVGAAAGGFFALGGRLSEEHRRGFQQIRR